LTSNSFKNNLMPHTTPESPQVLLLAPLDPKDLTHQKLLGLLVEYGIHIASDSHDNLPTTLPNDLTTFKALIIDQASPDFPLAQSRTPDKLIPYQKPRSFSWNDERLLFRILSALLMQYDVTPQNAAFLDRNAGRPDKDIILNQARSALTHEPEWFKMWNDASLVRLEGVWAAANHYHDQDLKTRVLACVDHIVAQYASAPEENSPLKGEPVRHPIFPGLLLPLWQDTGDTRYRDAALASMETFEQARDIAHDWTHNSVFLQAESMDRKPWQWAMRARWCNQPEFFQPAVDVMKAGFAALFDGQNQLWAHYGYRNGIKGHHWGRGQGWALYGLLGLLEHLPQNHIDRPLLLHWLDLTSHGLSRVQDPQTGLWRNVMDQPSTRLEVSGTAKCIRHFSRAWRLGLCRQPHLPDMLARAWRGLKAHTFNHQTCSRVYGTGPGYNLPFYCALPAGPSRYACVHAGSEFVQAFGD
jgi:rhamnogalacturonyl hydrolase YesR